MKALLKVASVIAFGFIAGMTVGMVQSRYLSQGEGFPRTKAIDPTRKPIFGSADAPCVPTTEARYLSIDAPLFSVHFSNESYTVLRPTGFALKSVEQSAEGLIANVFTDGQYATVPIPNEQLWAVQFCREMCVDRSALNLNNPFWWLKTVSPCAWQERKERARSVFTSAFAAMQEGEAYSAASLFMYGLFLDSTSALAWFYLAETSEDDPVTEGAYYRLALQLGLPPELQSIAEERAGS